MAASIPVKSWCLLLFAKKLFLKNITTYACDWPGNTKGGTVDLLFDWLGISCMTTDKFCFYLQNRLIQTSQTGGQGYSDTSPFSIPWIGNAS